VADLTIEGLDELDALHAKATPGEWRLQGGAGNRLMYVRAGTRPDAIATLRFVATRGVPREQRDADAQSIAALHNAWPSVSAMLRRALSTPAAVPDLVFGEREKYGGRRVATAADGAIYMATPEYSGRGGPLEREEGVSLRCPNETWGTSYPTEAEAIAAANAHNAARLAKKGGE